MFRRVCDWLSPHVTSIRARRSGQTNTGAAAKLRSPDALHPFNIRELPGCHAGTFNAVILRLLDWVSTTPTPVLWLTGPASTGKSAVARCFATHWKSEGYLGVCSSVNGTRNSIKSVVPTLASQIANAIPELQSHIAKVAVDNPRSCKLSFPSQFERFISNPILQVKLSPARRSACLPILIVVDGIDECNDEKERSLFLKTILEAAPRLRRYLRFLVVSRPEIDIRNFFETTSIQDETNVIDLSTYLINTTVRDNIKPKVAYGPAILLHDLDGLFRTILSSSRTKQTTLVPLLSVVLVCVEADVSLIPFNDIPMSLTRSDRFMESILGLEPGYLQSSLSDLKSLVNFRRKTMATVGFHDIRIVEVCHQSLKAFLMDQSRSGGFHIDLKVACLNVAKSILRILADNDSVKQSYWIPGVSKSECDPRPAYHNCLVWCYEHLTPDGDLQRAMMEYDPIDYLFLGRKRIAYPTAVAFFTFACKFLRRFEDIPSLDMRISRHLRGRFDSYLISELDYWVPENSALMRVLRLSILSDHIDWESFRASEAMLRWDQEAISRRVDDSGVIGHLPYFLTWIFDKGLGYAGSTVERTMCHFFHSKMRAGKYYFGSV